MWLQIFECASRTFSNPACVDKGCCFFTHTCNVELTFDIMFIVCCWYSCNGALLSNRQHFNWNLARTSCKAQTVNVNAFPHDETYWFLIAAAAPGLFSSSFNSIFYFLDHSAAHKHCHFFLLLLFLISASQGLCFELKKPAVNEDSIRCGRLFMADVTG